MDNSDDELGRDGLREACGRLDAIESDLLAIELGGTEIDEALVDGVLQALRAVHAFAESSQLVQTSKLADQTGAAISLILSHRMAPTPERVNVLLRAVDTMRELLQNPGTCSQAGIAAIGALLSHWCADDPGYASGGAAPREPPASGKLRALLVEDDFSSRLVLHTFLSRYGECHVATNGAEAVAAWIDAKNGGKSYDLICMDIMMPGMDGREAVRQIRASEQAQGIRSTSGVKIIMTTTVDDIREVAHCFHELCDAYLVKPIELSQLLGYLKEYSLAS
jgi:two-component system chemotaxis response regulator CheY